MKNLKKVFAIVIVILTFAATMTACGIKTETTVTTQKATEETATFLIGTTEEETTAPTKATPETTVAETTVPTTTVPAETKAQVTAPKAENAVHETEKTPVNKPQTTKPAEVKPEPTRPVETIPVVTKPAAPAYPTNSQHYYQHELGNRWKENKVTVAPKEWYFEDGKFIMHTFVVNGYSDARLVNVEEIMVTDANGNVFAYGPFKNQNMQINGLSYLEYSFSFKDDALAQINPDLSSLSVDIVFDTDVL